MKRIGVGAKAQRIICFTADVPVEQVKDKLIHEIKVRYAHVTTMGENTAAVVSNFPSDQVFSLREGEFLCMVRGRVFGVWDTAAIAEAGMQVEQRRVISRRECRNV